MRDPLRHHGDAEAGNGLLDIAVGPPAMTDGRFGALDQARLGPAGSALSSRRGQA